MANMRAVDARKFYWTRRVLLGLSILIVGFLFIVLPIGAPFLITNSRFRYPERGTNTAEAAGLTVEEISFTATDGISLRGWWNPGDPEKAVIIFCHGWHRSRLELLDRAAESHRRGYGTLLFDFRNHGQSSVAMTTLGINESRDVCAARKFVSERVGSRPQVLWGVSMGASSAILGARACPGTTAIVSDSAFLSLRETVGHHVGLLFNLPAFPIANLIIGISELRTGIDADDGNVEAALREIDTPVLFIAGGSDRRMPVSLAERLMKASSSPIKELLVIPGAGHGEAFSTDPDAYLNGVFHFLEKTIR